MRLHDLEFEWEYAEGGYIQFSATGEGAETIDCADLKKGLLAGSYQDRVGSWLEHCFGESSDPSRRERRAHRFIEESLEFAQSVGATKEDALALVEYVFARPVGEPAQEVGGVMLTLMGAASANGLNVNECAETELSRVWTNVDAMRAKNARQVKGSPLPGSSEGETCKIDARTGRPYGDHGTALQAIDFAMNSSTCQEPLTFLNSWRDGDLKYWPDFYEWLKKEESK